MAKTSCRAVVDLCLVRNAIEMHLQIIPICLLLLEFTPHAGERSRVHMQLKTFHVRDSLQSASVSRTSLLRLNERLPGYKASSISD